MQLSISVKPLQNELELILKEPLQAYYVPIADRRDVLSWLVMISDATNARHYPDSAKLTIVFLVAFAAVSDPTDTSYASCT